MSEQTIYAKASVERKPEYRQQTLIIRDGGRTLARKVPIDEAAGDHIRSYKKNYETLTGALKEGSRISFVSCIENEDGSVDFPFCTGRTLGDLLAASSPDDYIRIVQRFRDALIRSFEVLPFQITDEFQSFYGTVSLPKNLEALAVTNADMNFDNVFCCAGDTYTIIDYEWVFTFPVPLACLMYRSLLLDPAFSRFSEDEKQQILDSFGITETLKESFDRMELAFLRNISPEEYKLDWFARVPEARKNILHDINILLTFPEMNKKLAGEVEEYNQFQRKWWFRVFRRLDGRA